MRKPTSPHLQIYRLQITSGLSALHRISGVVLSITSAKIMIGLLVAGFFPESWSLLRAIVTPVSITIGLSVLGCVWFFHSLTTLRYLYWDFARGLDVPDVIRSGQCLLVLWMLCSLAFVVFLWNTRVL
ncbi:MAG: succinate dehydrogenase, cytochrome b556 subunit [Alphaproteobacteria bacterium]|nr:MAG: succinate dehydrogenase, cytochrome b556 subunit [Alphaproteobacteria bacterium]